MTTKVLIEIPTEALSNVKKGTMDMADVMYALRAITGGEAQKVGEWIEKDGFDGDVYYDCSVCGESWTTIEGTPLDNDMNYCPHCGAKMEGVEYET